MSSKKVLWYNFFFLRFNSRCLNPIHLYLSSLPTTFASQWMGYGHFAFIPLPKWRSIEWSRPNNKGFQPLIDTYLSKPSAANNNNGKKKERASLCRRVKSTRGREEWQLRHSIWMRGRLTPLFLIRFLAGWGYQNHFTPCLHKSTSPFCGSLILSGTKEGYL